MAPWHPSTLAPTGEPPATQRPARACVPPPAGCRPPRGVCTLVQRTRVHTLASMRTPVSLHPYAKGMHTPVSVHTCLCMLASAHTHAHACKCAHTPVSLHACAKGMHTRVRSQARLCVHPRAKDTRTPCEHVQACTRFQACTHACEFAHLRKGHAHPCKRANLLVRACAKGPPP